jgi:riboflavin transporter FmnP
MFYFLCFLIGTGTGYWALFVSVAAEHFGTNIRATVTTTAPNFVRGMVIPVTFLYKWIESFTSNIQSALIVGAIVMSIALWSLHTLKETFGKDLNYLES